MKKRILKIGVMLLLQVVTISGVAAQVENIQTTVEKFVWENSQLTIELRLDMNGVDISTRQGIECTPIVSMTNEDITLPSVLLMGRENYKQYKRVRSLMSPEELENSPEPYVIIKEFGNNPRIVEYKYTHACTEPISEYKLKISNKVLGCGKMILKHKKNLATLSPKLLIPYLTCVVPKVTVIGTEEDQFNIYFRYDRYDIDSSYMDNSVSLDGVNDFITEIQSHGDTTIAKVVIGGFSSIEGSYKYNTALSLKRANAIYDYVFKDSKFDLSIIELYNGAENWSGLREVVVASDMKNKDEVLAVIDSDPIDARDRKLIRLDGGATYRYIKKNFFPKLRSSTFIKVFYKYDDDQNAKSINKAIEHINAKEYAEALDILNEISSDERAQNAIGVCYMMMGDLVNAKSYLQKSLGLGDKDAQKNLKQVERRLP